MTRKSRFRRICVFCGSSSGENPIYVATARDLGALLAQRGIGVVYGGAKVGLMGTLADAALVHGGEVIGVIPEKLKSREIAHEELSELFVVESMHARKTMMAHLSDAFIALPGGWGTLEETFEIVTWTQLRYHFKPVGLLNVNGYYDRLLDFVAHATTEGFIQPEHRRILHSAGNPEAIVATLESAELPAQARLIDKP
jgi:uncharacterized protein (TIGR00730 family)